MAGQWGAATGTGAWRMASTTDSCSARRWASSGHAERVGSELESAEADLAGIQSLGNVAASAIAGLLWTSHGPTWAFGFLAAAMLAATLLLGSGPPNRQKAVQ